jgi:hypothetical protein
MWLIRRTYRPNFVTALNAFRINKKQGFLDHLCNYQLFKKDLAHRAKHHIIRGYVGSKIIRING